MQFIYKTYKKTDVFISEDVPYNDDGGDDEQTWLVDSAALGTVCWDLSAEILTHQQSSN